MFTASVDVSVITTELQWEALQPEWNGLLQDSTADSVFLTWEWVDSWLRIFERVEDWLVLTARTTDGFLVGVAPMMVHRDPRLKLRRLVLVGQDGDTSAEYLEWLLRRGWEEVVALAFARHLRSAGGNRWDALDFDMMRVASEGFSPFTNALQSMGLHPVSTTRGYAPYAALPPTWDEFLHSHSASFRQRWKRFGRKHQVRLLTGGQGVEVDTGMDRIRDMNQARWQESGQSFRTERYLEFHRQVAGRFHTRGWLAMLFLEVDGEILAGRYDFAYAGKCWNFQGGWVPGHEKLSLGKMLLMEEVKWCVERGLTEYDFLAGEASYKDEWATGRRELARVEATNPRSMRGRLFFMLRRLKRMLRPVKREISTSTISTDQPA
ncbi:MAG: GNAT family N-acetyltransferase [Roseimicrobium sp.]